MWRFTGARHAAMHPRMTTCCQVLGTVRGQFGPCTAYDVCTLMRHVWCSVEKAKLLQGVVLLYEVSSVCVHQLATWQHPIYPEQWRTNSSQHALGSQASNVTFGAFQSPRFHIGHVCPVKQLRLWFMCNLSFRVFGQGSCSVRPVGQDGHAGQDGDVEAVMFIRFWPIELLGQPRAEEGGIGVVPLYSPWLAEP